MPQAKQFAQISLEEKTLDKDSTKKKQKHWVKKRHAAVFAFLRFAMAPFLWLRYHYRAEKAPIRKGPCIVLSNHQATMDPFFISKAFPFQLYFYASDDLFNLKVSPLIRYLAAPIPKSKSVADLKAVMISLRVLREGGAIGITPEGNRTLSGRQWEMGDSVAKLVKTAKVPLVLFNLCGGYGTDPRWGVKIRRGTKFVGRVRRILTPEEYAGMSDEELFGIIKNELDVDDTLSGERYKSRRRAEYIERALYMCPVCGSIGTIHSHGTGFCCTSCKTEAEYTEDLKISPPVGGYSRIYEWYEWERQEIVRRILGGEKISDGDILFRESMKLQKKIKLPGNTVTLDKDSLMISGGGAETRYPLAEIDAITAVGKKKFNFYYKGKILQVKGGKRFCAIKYVHAFDGIRAARKEEKQ